MEKSLEGSANNVFLFSKRDTSGPRTLMAKGAGNCIWFFCKISIAVLLSFDGNVNHSTEKYAERNKVILQVQTALKRNAFRIIKSSLRHVKC